eukprot:3372188-Ditylum_brightwellii.AAC.1
MIDVRLRPRPSSRPEVVSVPIRVDLPASTFPTTATRILREERVSEMETGFSSSFPESVLVSPIVLPVAVDSEDSSSPCGDDPSTD